MGEARNIVQEVVITIDRFRQGQSEMQHQVTRDNAVSQERALQAALIQHRHLDFITETVRHVRQSHADIQEAGDLLSTHQEELRNIHHAQKEEIRHLKRGQREKDPVAGARRHPKEPNEDHSKLFTPVTENFKSPAQSSTFVSESAPEHLSHPRGHAHPTSDPLFSERRSSLRTPSVPPDSPVAIFPLNCLRSKLAPMPEFTPGEFPSWRRENPILGGELYAYVPENQIIANIGLRANSSLRRVVMSFMRDSPISHDRRTVAALLSQLDEQYVQTSREKEMEALGRWVDLRRGPGDSIRNFWWEFENLLRRMDRAKSTLSEDLVFTRAPKALQLNHVQRTTVLMALGAQRMEHSQKNLKNCTARLSGTYEEDSSLKKPDKLFATHEES